MSKNILTYGILGGGFMGARTYPRALRAAAQIAAEMGIEIRVTHIYIRDKSKHAAIRLQTGIENVTDDLDAVINSCDVVCNCLPNNAHLEATLKAIAKGKHVVCEKPLGDTLAAAEELSAAATQAGVHSLMGTCYVGADAVRTGREIVHFGDVIAEGITPWFSGRFNFLQDWRIGFTGNWRFERAVAGAGGILDDLMQHSLSVAFAWLGKSYRVTDVKADIYYADGVENNITFIDGTHPTAKSRAVDQATATVRFEGGSTLLFEATRFARGHKAFSWAELNGEAGSISWELQNGHTLNQFKHEPDARSRGWTNIHCSGGEHGNVLSVSGLTQGYESYFAQLFAGFAIGICNETKHPTYRLGGQDVTPFLPDFGFGLFLQRLTSAMLASGYNGGTWQKVNF